jgi:hypothetical protein
VHRACANEIFPFKEIARLFAKQKKDIILELEIIIPLETCQTDIW